LPSNPIGYVDTTWNPIVGCSEICISPGCRSCWALRMAKRLAAVSKTKPGLKHYRNVVSKSTGWWSGRVHLVEKEVYTPGTWTKTTRRVAVSFMGDIALAAPKTEFGRVLMTMRLFDRHTYLLLTKRPLRLKYQVLALWGAQQTAPLGRLADSNVWWGLSLCTQAEVREVPHILEAAALVPTANVYLSIEPMLEAIDIAPHLKGIRWVIVGGENGPGARPFKRRWADEIVGACARAGVPVWVKGKEWDGVPALRQIPANKVPAGGGV
jgi:protein gp37